MKKWSVPIVGLSLIIIGGLVVCSVNKPQPSQRATALALQKEEEMSQERLKELYRQVNQAMVDKDTESLEALLLPDSVLIHMTGYSQPVSEWLDQIESEEMKYYSWQEEAIENIVMDGDQASLSGRSRVQARIWGAGPHVWRLQIDMEFERIDGQWYISRQVASTY